MLEVGAACYKIQILAEPQETWADVDVEPG